MKTKILLAVISVLSGLDARATSTKFATPLVLKGESIFATQKVQRSLRDEVVESVISESNYNCAYSVSIDGRTNDRTLPSLGEFYHGKMEVDCQDGPIGRKAFKSHFSRVLLVGVGACIVNKDGFFNDACTLRALALQTEFDHSTQSDILFKSNRKTVIRKLVSDFDTAVQEGWDEISQVLPDSNLRKIVDTALVFEVVFNRDVSQSFVVPIVGGFAAKESHRIEIDATSIQSDAANADKILEDIENLEKAIVSNISIGAGITASQTYIKKINGLKSLATLIVNPYLYAEVTRRLENAEELIGRSLDSSSVAHNDDFRALNYNIFLVNAASRSVNQSQNNQTPKKKQKGKYAFSQSLLCGAAFLDDLDSYDVQGFVARGLALDGYDSGCHDIADGREYSVVFNGVGLGLSGTLVGVGLGLSCTGFGPLVGKYVAADIHGAFVFGLEGMAFTNGKRVCVLAGAKVVSLGAGLALGTMEIKHGED